MSDDPVIEEALSLYNKTCYVLMDEKDDIPQEMLDELKRHKQNMTVKCRIGIDIGHMKGVKAMYLGGKKIWDNPDYQEGGIFYEDTNSG